MERIITAIARPFRGRGNLARDCFAALAITTLVACTPNAASLTIVNPGTTDVKIGVDERPYKLVAGSFLNLQGIKPGQHYVKVANSPVQPITLEPKKTTVMDVTGSGCYVVANFTPQYALPSGGTVIIEERFKKQPLFTIHTPLTVRYGETLPRKVDVGSTIYRLHAVDCSIIEVDRAILEAISQLP